MRLSLIGNKGTESDTYRDCCIQSYGSCDMMVAGKYNLWRSFAGVAEAFALATEACSEGPGAAAPGEVSTLGMAAQRH